MDIYDHCLNLQSLTLNHHDNTADLIPASPSANDDTTVPSSLQPTSIYRKYFSEHVYYISDVHLPEKIVGKFPNGASNAKLKAYVREIVQGLFRGNLATDIIESKRPAIIFGGDISSSFDVSKLFYSAFVEEWDTLEQREKSLRADYKPAAIRHIYAVLGNHELQDFKSLEDCRTAYDKLFRDLKISFLHNSALGFGSYDPPVKIVEVSDGDSVKFREVVIKKGEDGYESALLHTHNLVVIGSLGFAGYNDTLNANSGLYGKALTREEEISECDTWNERYKNFLNLAREHNYSLVVVTHTPISDWKKDGLPDSGCTYFTGHTHQDYLYHCEQDNIHIFANNQVGYNNTTIQFKEAYIYRRYNPFVNYSDGVHEVTSEDYIRFHDYICEGMRGRNGVVERQIRDFGGKFYMIKHDGYYGFFVCTNKSTCICAGGRLKKISSNTDINFFDANFAKMVQQYIKIMLPYRSAQERISNAVKSFGGTGRIHGCMVDIDFLSHIMLNPSDGRMTYYFSPMFGQVQIYDNLISLLENHNKSLLPDYLKLLEDPTQELDQITDTSALTKIKIKGSAYTASGKINQLQRLFTKKVLRDWNDSLLLADSSQKPPLPPKRNRYP